MARGKQRQGMEKIKADKTKAKLEEWLKVHRTDYLDGALDNKEVERLYPELHRERTRNALIRRYKDPACPAITCIHCAGAALSDRGYISDEELAKYCGDNFRHPARR